MATKILHSLELPIITTDLETNPDSGFARLYVQEGKIVRKLPDGSVQTVAFEYAPSSEGESNPVYTYTNDDITRIDYSSGNYKLLTYSAGNLTQLDYVKGSVTYRKTFNYDISERLISITESVV